MKKGEPTYDWSTIVREDVFRVQWMIRYGYWAREVREVREVLSYI